MDEEIAKTGASMGIGKLIDKYSSGILVRSPNKTHWVPRTSAAGQAIIGNSLKIGNCSNPNAMPALIAFNQVLINCGSIVN